MRAKHETVTPASRQSRLAAWREYRGWTQDQLARYTGIPQRTISNLEGLKAAERPNVRHYIQCALALGCELEDILEQEWLEWRPLRGAERPPGAAAYGPSIGRQAMMRSS